MNHELAGSMQSSGKEQVRQAVQQAEGVPTNVYLGGVVGSIVVSALLFMMGKKNLGIFVGLWPPTLLNMALFMKRLRPSDELM